MLPHHPRHPEAWKKMRLSSSLPSRNGLEKKTHKKHKNIALILKDDLVVNFVYIANYFCHIRQGVVELLSACREVWVKSSHFSGETSRIEMLLLRLIPFPTQTHIPHYNGCVSLRHGRKFIDNRRRQKGQAKKKTTNMVFRGRCFVSMSVDRLISTFGDDKPCRASCYVIVRNVSQKLLITN